MKELSSKVLVGIGKRILSLGRKIRPTDKNWMSTLKRWEDTNEKLDYRYNYPDLQESSLVYDLGGFRGQWSSDMYAKYRCKIEIFEPHPEFFKKIENRFSKNEDIIVHSFGLASTDSAIDLNVDGDATSSFKKGKTTVRGKLRNIGDFLAKKSVDKIDLMKINIEGGEYDLLENLIDTGLIEKVKRLQIQFHHFIPEAEERMLKIQESLETTHKVTYQFIFLWEDWKLKE